MMVLYSYPVHRHRLNDSGDLVCPAVKADREVVCTYICMYEVLVSIRLAEGCMRRTCTTIHAHNGLRLCCRRVMRANQDVPCRAVLLFPLSCPPKLRPEYFYTFRGLFIPALRHRSTTGGCRELSISHRRRIRAEKGDLFDGHITYIHIVLCTLSTQFISKGWTSACCVGAYAVVYAARVKPGGRGGLVASACHARRGPLPTK